VAKKVRQKPEDAAPAFEFPAFDEVAFVAKESEMTLAMIVALAITFVLGAISWALTSQGVDWYGPFAVGVIGLIVSPTLIGRLRPKSTTYTKGDWAGLLALEFFGWLALWFVLVNVV
jgi:hypothetical protein